MSPAAPVEDVAVEDVAVEDVAVEDVAVEDVAVEDVAVEDVAVEDVAVEDVAVEDVAEPIAPPALEKRRPTPGPPIAEPKSSLPVKPLVAVLLAAVLLVGSISWLTYLNGRKPLGAHAQQPTISDAGVYSPGTIDDSTGAAAVRAAVVAVPAVLSYDYRSLATGIATAKTYLTPGYSKVYDATYATSVSKVATANKAVVRALVRAAGLVNISGGSATVLLFVDEALVASGGATSPTISPDRVKLTLLRSHGKWLIDSVQPF